MGFEEFLVALYPLEVSPLHSGNDTASLRRLIEEVQAEWPTLHHDAIETERRFPSEQAALEILVSDTWEGLFQVFLSLGSNRKDEIALSLHFAYTNPPSIYEPTFSFIEWSMYEYKLYCCVVPDFAPNQKVSDDKIISPKDIRSILLPCIEYNRRLWQLDADTDEEAILRPGDAVAQFITPRFNSSPQNA